MGYTPQEKPPLSIRKIPSLLRNNPLGGTHVQPCRSDEKSTSYSHNPLEGARFKIVDCVQKEYAPSISDNIKQRGKICNEKNSEIVTTAELISAVFQLWDCASRPLSVLQSKSILKHLDTEWQKDNIFHYVGEGNIRAHTSDDCEFFCVDLKTPSHPELENVKASQELSLSGPSDETCTHPFFSKYLQDGTNMFNETGKGHELASVRNSYKLAHIYKWMHEIALGVKFPASVPLDENNKIGDSTIPGDIVSPASCCVAEKQTASCHANSINNVYSSSSEKEEPVRNANASFTPLCSEYFLGAVQDTYNNVHASQLDSDHHVSSLVSSACASKELQQKTEGDGVHGEKSKQHKMFPLESGPKKETLPLLYKPHYTLAKQEHAFAGALAGIFVSLCLHPVDTVKTVVQSCHAKHNSISYVSKSIISERGLAGLYRGFSSNIASSAPISALYTFTYESVKGALLPLIPKEYCSFAHCVAGGCASVATSFIFTPSERIKQQVQVGSHYENSWNALVGVLKKGGLPSLYAGWGAVLCRNVPHSIIKFYTYETLKQLMLSSLQPNAQLNTFQTLVCGGLAGSTAALFTTPFDVVKTRLQTQVPGSVNQHGGVFHTLQQIGMHEGLKGLYRGLIPRLVMYMSQGALFFASYESFKRLLSLEVPQLGADIIQYKPKLEDDSEPKLHTHSQRSASGA